jgi:serine/alanine adding enzyme
MAPRPTARTSVSELSEVPAGEWDALLDRLGLGDVYFRSAYLESARLLGQGEPVFLHLGDASGDVVFPVLVREAPEGRADVGTPMGYGGPLAAGEDPPVDNFFAAYDRWCREHRIVATFARFQPALANQQLADGRWHLEHIGHSVGWRVGGRNADEIAEGLDGHHRRAVRKARRAGIEVTLEEHPADVSGFVTLYEETMRRLDATPFYFFPDAYWAQLAGPLGELLVRADASVEGEVVASILCFASPPLLHYHLGASSERGQALGANHLLFLETAAWAAEHGFERFHLGGRVGGFEDSLFEFKRRFDAGGALSAYLGKAVHDEETYRRLSDVAEIDYTGYFPAYRRTG